MSELDQRLAEVDALRKRVLNVIPHALRTPITTFRGLAEALVTASDDQIREEIGPALRRLAAQAEHLLDDMLIAAGYTTALPTTAAEPTPVEETVAQVWTEIGGAGDEIVVTSVGGQEVLMPPGSLFKVLVHLLDNARKYGDPPVRVDVAPEDGSTVLLEVRAAGPVPRDHAMFVEPFYRGEAAVIRAPGLGVGLTVARALAEQAGGSVEVRAGEGENGGVIARVVLPAAGARP